MMPSFIFSIHNSFSLIKLFSPACADPGLAAGDWRREGQVEGHWVIRRKRAWALENIKLS